VDVTTTLERRPLALKEATVWTRRPYVQAVAAYLIVRAFSVALLALFASNYNKPLLDRLTAWDGQWYLSIAEHGYRGITHGLVDAAGNFAPNTPLAFFPAYPTLLRGLASGTGLSPVNAALVVSLIAGSVAACGIHRIGTLVDDRPRVGILLVTLWAGAPMAITLSMAYTEALFAALAAWTLVAVLEKKWLLAALCCVGAGLTRSTAIVLIGIVVFAALIEVFRKRARWPEVVCIFLSPLGLLGFWLYVANRTNSWTGWFDLERRGWATRFDGGKETLEFVKSTLVSGSSVMEPMTAFVVLGTVVLAVLLAKSSFTARVPWPLTGYGAGVVVLITGTAGLPFAKARFLLPAFTLLLPVAVGLAGRRRSTQITVAVGFVLLGCWFSAYSLTGWRYAI
jgi:hypothetical protein